MGQIKLTTQSEAIPQAKWQFCEFFAGGGMARLGLGPSWQCAFANDSSGLKVSVYEQNFGLGSICPDNVASLSSSTIPRVDLLWASFPCQDLSLAGRRGGLHDVRSGAFWAFWKAVRCNADSSRRTPVVVLENVVGLLTSGKGSDFAQLVHRLRSDGYEVGALIIDAAVFLPHSRKRLFIVAVSSDSVRGLPGLSQEPSPVWHPSVLRRAVDRLEDEDKAGWLWWSPPIPSGTVPHLSSMLDNGDCVEWDSQEKTNRLLGLMSENQFAKLKSLQCTGETWVGSLVMRRRKQANGEVLQRAEVRFDGLANCIRTAGGGASIQRIISASVQNISTRKMTITEAARLMGLPSGYELPYGATDAYQVLGDGLAIPVVEFLNEHVLEPLMEHLDRK